MSYFQTQTQVYKTIYNMSCVLVWKKVVTTVSGIIRSCGFAGVGMEVCHVGVGFEVLFPQAMLHVVHS